MGTDLGELKESKLPTYKVGVSSPNYRILLLAAAASWSRTKEVFEGDILEQVRQSIGGANNLTADQLQECEDENKRTYNDLMNCMSMTGNWLQIIKDSKSTEFWMW